MYVMAFVFILENRFLFVLKKGWVVIVCAP